MRLKDGKPKIYASPSLQRAMFILIGLIRPIRLIGAISLSVGSITNCINKKREKLSFLSFLRGGYLLSHLRSTIGVVRFNFSVRDGKRWSPDAIAT